MYIEFKLYLSGVDMFYSCSVFISLLIFEKHPTRHWLTPGALRALCKGTAFLLALGVKCPRSDNAHTSLSSRIAKTAFRMG